MKTNHRKPRAPITPLRFLLVTMFVVWGVGGGVMLAMPFWLPSDASAAFVAVVDLSLLTLIGVPMLWFAVIRPTRLVLHGATDYTDKIIRSMIDMLIVVAPDGKIITINEATRKLLGYREDELIGLPASLLFSEEEEEDEEDEEVEKEVEVEEEVKTLLIVSQGFLPFKRTVLRRLVRDGAINNIKRSLRVKTGHTIPVLLSGSVMRHDDRTIQGIVCVAQDIRPRKLLEAELRASNRDLIAVNGVHSALFSCQSAREVAETLTDALVREFGAHFARVWLIGKGDLCSECALSNDCRDNKRCLHLTASAGHYTHIDGDHRRVPLGAFKIGLIAQGRGKTLSNDVVNDDRVHDRNWAAKQGLKSFAGFPLVRNGEPIGVMAMFSKQALQDSLLQALDLLAQVGAAALTNVSDAEELRKLSVAVEQSPASIVITDTRGTIEYVNPRFTEVTGYTAQEAIGQNPRILKSGCKPRRAYEKLWDTILAGHVWTGAFENKKKNGDIFWEEASISPIRDASNTVTHFLAVKQDITERKKAEASLRESELELRKHRDHLEDLVNERTAELKRINDTLVYEVEYRRLAEEAAAAASCAKGDFLATMSHELRTPLNGVIGMLELLLRSDLGEKQRRHAWLAKTSGDTLLTLINDILDFSKIEAGKLELETADFDLRYTVESLGASLASRAESKGLELICSVHPQVPVQVRGDPGRLQQILLNLTSNAIKFTEHGEIVVRATKDDETNRYVTVRFTVTDTGIGIPPDRRDRLFQSFSQVDASTTRKYGGTGLGLAISNQLVELMDGDIGVESEPDRGSTFWFTVKLERQADNAPPPREVRDELRDVRILAVDDNPMNREILAEQLSSFGFDNENARNGEEALARLRDAASGGTPFGLAILDMQMPEMDGEQLAQSIRSDPSLEDTILVLLTSGGIVDDSDRLRSLGFSGWLTKPIRQSQLLNSIVETLACARSVRSHLNLAPSGDGTQYAPKIRAATTAVAHILLAEDNEISKEAAVELLALAGYSCEAVTNGQEAVRAVLEHEYDLILMDCQMPEMDGFGATRAIRRHEKDGMLSRGVKGRMPIIALTANAIKGDRERCLESGMDDYLTKPLDPNRLVQVIESHLTSKGGGSHASPVGGSDEPPTETKPAEDTVGRAAADEPPPFDTDALLKRWGGNKAFAEKLIAKFCGQAPCDLEKLEQAVTASDVEEATRFAHGLKGAASYVAADAFREVAARLEEMGRAGDLSDAEVCLSELHTELKRCLECRPNRLDGVEPQHASTDR